MASYSGMSAEDIKMREDYKKQQAAAITASRDYKKNNYLSAMEQQTATQPSVTTTPKTKTNTQTLGGTSSTGGSSSSGGYTGGGYVAGSGTTTRNTRRNAHAADIRSGYKLRNEAEDETQSLSYYDKLSDYDRDVRTQYFYDTKVQEAKTQQEIQSLAEENDDLFAQSVPIAQRASAGATGARHHNNYLQNQIADNNARINQLNGSGIVISPKDADALREKYASDIATSRAETDVANSGITADDLDGMSREDYEAGCEKHLAEQMKRDAVSTAAFKGMEALDWTQKYQGKRYTDTFGGNFGASFSKGQIELELNLAYGDYLKDPSEANRNYICSLETLLDQYQTNNAQSLDDAPLSVISQDLAYSLPEWWNQTQSKLVGAAIGAWVPGSLAVNALLGSTATGSANAHRLTQGAAFRRLINAGVDEESARKAANDEAVIAALAEIGGAAFGETTDIWIDASKRRILNKALRDIGVEIASDSYLDHVSQANVERSLSGNADNGVGDLFLRGFMRD